MYLVVTDILLKKKGERKERKERNKMREGRKQRKQVIEDKEEGKGRWYREKKERKVEKHLFEAS